MNNIEYSVKKIISNFFLNKIEHKIKHEKTINLIENKKLLSDLFNKNKTTCYICNRNMKKNIDISIIIPVYNNEEFISLCLDSILNNKTKFIYEIIVVNDGSTDKTGIILDQYKLKYSNIINVIHQKNGGVSKARNVGINNANGKYISLLDSDDYLDDNYIEMMLNTAIEKKADIVRCGNVDVKKGIIISKHISKYEEIIGPMGEKIVDYPSYVWGCVIKSSLIDNIQFPNEYWYEDMIWRFLVYRQSKKFINLDKALYYRTLHKKNTSKVLWDNRSYKSLEQLYLIETLVSENNKFKLQKDAYMYLNVLFECSSIMLSRIYGLDDSVKQQVFIRVYNLANQLFKEEYEFILPEKYKIVNDIILNKRYDLWLMLRYVKL